jgi:hypothetical protein
MGNYSTSSQRWAKSSSYPLSWGTRSALVKGLIERTLPNQSLSYTEYGCGKNSPFSNLIGTSSQCIRYDLTSWDQDCSVVDLNDDRFDVASSDVAVLCGVVEYLNSPRATFSRLAMFHKYIAFSYFPASPSTSLFHSCVRSINRRALRNGWRNHYTESLLLSTFEGIMYYISATSMKKQIICLGQFC